MHSGLISKPFLSTLPQGENWITQRRPDYPEKTNEFWQSIENSFHIYTIISLMWVKKAVAPSSTMYSHIFP